MMASCGVVDRFLSLNIDNATAGQQSKQWHQEKNFCAARLRWRRGRDQWAVAPMPALPPDTMPLMRRHSAAQRRQALAQSWQCCIGCLPHSAAHMSQISAQDWQIMLATSLPLAIAPAARRHIWEQSISRAIQRAIDFTSCSCKQPAAHMSQARAQSLQASMQDAN
jgi:hypothetical protein